MNVLGRLIACGWLLLVFAGCSPSTNPLTTSDVAKAGIASTFRVVPCAGVAGSGVHLGNGIVLTVAHVLSCSPATTYFSTPAPIRVEDHAARLIAVDRDLDLALLGVPDLVGRPSLQWGDTSGLSVGDPIVAVGFPITGQTVTSGIVSAVKTVLTPGPAAPTRFFSSPQPRRSLVLIQTDAALNPGNSGGPLLNKAGELVGIVDFRIEGGNYGLNFAVASTTAQPWVEEMRGR